MQCDRCQKTIEPGQDYRHCGERLCADCCMRAREVRRRKTHWQYLTAIRSGYLQPGPDKPAHAPEPETS